MKRYLPILLLLTCGAVLLGGVVYLFELRFETGDVYPEYSSLRSDPLGTMALFESLQRMQGMTVRRDFSVSNRLPDGTETAYFYFAASFDGLQALPDEALAEIERFVRGGGRFVITLSPVPNVLAPESKGYRNRWGVNFRNLALESRDGVYIPAPVSNESGVPLQKTLDWHSGIVFTNLNEAWQPVYTREDNPVVIERQFGRGFVVIATDSYFLSNEAMQKDRHADVLAWLVGPARNVVFDEAHLGVAESPGVATLVRRYNLTWFIAGLIVVAGLFIWKNSFSLIPLQEEQETEAWVEGKGGAAGFDNLLRRSIPEHDLLATCFNEWKKSAILTGKYSSTRIHQAEAVFKAEISRPQKDRNSVMAWQAISGILRAKIK